MASDTNIGENPLVNINITQNFSPYRGLVNKVLSKKNKAAAVERKALWDKRVREVHKVNWDQLCAVQ